MPPAETAAPPFVPVGEHDRRLLGNVRPEGWENPKPRSRYDLVVVGGGTAGLVSAAGAAGLGARVALVERHLLGGDCLNVGCVPSKGVIAAARRWHAVFNGSAFGAPPHIGSGDFARAMERMRRLRADISPNDSAQRFRDLGVDVFLGAGRFVAPDAVEVDGSRLPFKRAVIATGARAASPPISGLAAAGFLTNESVFSLTQLPRRLAVIGAGPIGCELAQAFARLGSAVTLFDVLPRILTRDSADAAEVVARALQRDGVRLELGVTVDEVRGGGERTVGFSRGGDKDRVAVDHVLVAAGRAANVEGLGLDAAGVEASAKGVKVDEHFRTTNPNVFACGDVASPLQFTHAADAQARAVLRNAFFRGKVKAADLLVPWCTYTSPEVAHVGLQPEEAERQGLAVRTLRVELADVDRARLDGEDEGFLALHAAAKGGRILGATVVAERAGDLIAEICLAMRAKVGLATIADTIHPYPTQAEAVKKAADAWNRTRLTPGIRRLLGLWLRWGVR